MACVSVTDAANAPIGQDSQLLRMPGEIKNRIFELLMPTHSIIAPRAKKESVTSKSCLSDPSWTGEPYCYTYLPRVPPILQTCRELRIDAMSLYYGSNAFLFTDSMLQSQALKGFTARRGNAMTHLRIARVAHEYQVLKPYEDRRNDIFGNPVVLEVAVTYSMVFMIEMRDGKINMSTLESRQKSDRDGGDFQSMIGCESGICCCTLRSMIQECSEEPGQAPGLLPTILSRYANAVDVYKAEVGPRLKRDPRRQSNGDEVIAKLCEHCGRVKAI